MEPRLSFSGLVQHAWDSTSLITYKTCPRKYYYSIALGYRGKSDNPHLKFGTLMHHAMECFDHARVDKGLSVPLLISTLREVMTLAGKYDENRVWRAWKSDHKAKNLESLIRTIIYYYYQYERDSVQVIKLANGKAAVELPFRLQLPKLINGVSVQYCGHMDQLNEFGLGVYFMDRKTTGSYLSPNFYDQFKMSLQMTGYYTAAKIVYKVEARGGIIDAMSIGEGYTRFGRGPVNRTESQIEEFLEDCDFTFTEAMQRAEEGKEKSFPMNQTACHLYNSPCAFVPLCSRTPEVRERFLEADYIRVPWDPLAKKGIE